MSWRNRWKRGGLISKVDRNVDTKCEFGIILAPILNIGLESRDWSNGCGLVVDGAGNRSRSGGAKQQYTVISGCNGERAARWAFAGSGCTATTSATTTAATAATFTTGATEPGGRAEARADLLGGECDYREEGGRPGPEVRPHAHGSGSGRWGGHAWLHWAQADFVRRCHRARGQFCGLRNSYVSWKRWHPYGFSFQSLSSIAFIAFFFTGLLVGL